MDYEYYLRRLNLQGLVKKSSGLWNFKCPICGDSKKKSNKKRGYYIAISKDGQENVIHCHNCGFHKHIKWFIKELNEHLFLELIEEEIKNKKHVKKEKKKNISKNNQYINPEKFKFYKYNDPIWKTKEMKLYNIFKEDAELFLKERKLWEFKDKFFLSLHPHYYFRIIIPIKDKNGIYGFQARSLKNNDNYKYLTKFYNNDLKHIYNYYHINRNKNIMVTEGPFDSLFLNNSIALLSVNKIGEIKNLPKNNLIFVLDNDDAGIKNTKKMLEKGYKCFIYPEKYKYYKDINEIIIKEDIKDINNIVLNNVFNNFEGLVRLSFLENKNGYQIKKNTSRSSWRKNIQ